MLTYVTSGLVIAILATDALAQEGCNDAVRRKCTTGTASVCFTDKCNGADVNGEAFNRRMVEEHNKRRRQAFTNGQFGADMIEVTWDKQLENAALGLAQQLCRTNSFNHDSFECRNTARYNSVGQNLMIGSGDRYKDETVVATEAVTLW